MPGLYAVKAIIFDLDGTLVDSAEDLRAALNKLVPSEGGLRPIKADEIKGMIGDGVLKLVERALVAATQNPAQKDTLLPRFLEIYLANPATGPAAIRAWSKPSCVAAARIFVSRS